MLHNGFISVVYNTCLVFVRYYEVKMLTDGMMRVGWATPCFPAGHQLGADEHSYAYDGFLVSSEELSCSYPSSAGYPMSPPFSSLPSSPYLPFLSRHASGTMDQRALEGDGMLRTLWAASWMWTRRPFVCGNTFLGKQTYMLL